MLFVKTDTTTEEHVLIPLDELSDNDLTNLAPVELYATDVNINEPIIKVGVDYLTVIEWLVQQYLESINYKNEYYDILSNLNHDLVSPEIWHRIKNQIELYALIFGGSEYTKPLLDMVPLELLVRETSKTEKENNSVISQKTLGEHIKKMPPPPLLRRERTIISSKSADWETKEDEESLQTFTDGYRAPSTETYRGNKALVFSFGSGEDDNEYGSRIETTRAGENIIVETWRGLARQ